MNNPVSTTGNNASGNYQFTANTNIRTAPSTTAQVVGLYNAGEVVHYIGQVQAEGYTWLKYVALSGNVRYVAVVN